MDTEPPPKLGGPEVQPDLPSAGEATRIGPAPDPGRFATSTRVGPPTPKNLRAAAPIGASVPAVPNSGQRLVAAPPPRSSQASVPNAPAAPDVALPLDVAMTQGPPNLAPTGDGSSGVPLSSPAPYVPPPRASSVVEGTAIGLAPLPGAPRFESGDARHSVGGVEAEPQVAPASSRAGVRQTASFVSDKALTRRCTSCNELYPSDFLVCPRDATPLVPVQGPEVDDPLVGTLIGDTYQIIRIIGEGGMGRVYEARHLRLKERRFAVKCLHTDLARNPEMAARFLREAESASSIKHDNVVDVFDVHHLADGTPYLVGEYLEGEELANYVMNRGPLEPRTAAKIARQVCSALAAAHARGIVHRDLKPENIFVLASSIAAVDRGESRTLHVKVLDFGISKAGHGDKSHLTRTGVIMGTPSYMSPEQARGRAVDHRADIYSLGACMYFMVTARRPFDSDDPTSTISMVLTEDPIRPRELDQRIPEALELIIQRAMAKDANDRYSSMEELEKALAVFAGNSNRAVPSSHAMLSIATPVGLELRASGAARAFDVAKAIIGSQSMGPPSIQQSSRLARAARPTIIITSSALGAWLVGGMVAALAGLVRVLHEGEVTLTESLLLVVGCLFAAATPLALYVMHLRKVIWPNSVRALQLATDLKRTTVAALVAYGGVSIIARVAHTVLWRSSRGLASGVWDIMLFVVSLAGALAVGLGPLLRNLKRRSSRD